MTSARCLYFIIVQENIEYNTNERKGALLVGLLQSVVLTD